MKSKAKAFKDWCNAIFTMCCEVIILGTAIFIFLFIVFEGVYWCFKGIFA